MIKCKKLRLQEYLACSQLVVNTTCGRDTAVFTAQFLDRMAAPLAQGHCENFTPSSQACRGLVGKYASTSASISTFSMASHSGDLLKALLFVILTIILH